MRFLLCRILQQVLKTLNNVPEDMFVTQGMMVKLLCVISMEPDWMTGLSELTGMLGLSRGGSMAGGSLVDRLVVTINYGADLNTIDLFR